MKKMYTLLLLSFALLSVSAQVGINTNTPNSSSVLHIVGPNKTVLLPKVANPLLLEGNPKLQAGILFDNRAGEKCINYITPSNSLSTCLLTSADVSSYEYSSASASAMNLTSSTYTPLVSDLVIPATITPQNLFVSADLMKRVEVSTLGACASTDLRLILINNTTSASTVLFENTTFLQPRKDNSVDIYPYTQSAYGSIQKNTAYTLRLEYRKGSSCSPLVDRVLSANLNVVTY